MGFKLKAGLRQIDSSGWHTHLYGGSGHPDWEKCHCGTPPTKFENDPRYPKGASDPEPEVDCERCLGTGAAPKNGFITYCPLFDYQSGECGATEQETPGKHCKFCGGWSFMAVVDDEGMDYRLPKRKAMKFYAMPRDEALIKKLRFVVDKDKQESVAYDGDKQIGRLNWGADDDLHISVDPKYHRKGVGTELYNRAHEVNPRIHHNVGLSDMAHQWASHGLDLQSWKYIKLNVEGLDAKDGKLVLPEIPERLKSQGSWTEDDIPSCSYCDMENSANPRKGVNFSIAGQWRACDEHRQHWDEKIRADECKPSCETDCKDHLPQWNRFEVSKPSKVKRVRVAAPRKCEGSTFFPVPGDFCSGCGGTGFPPCPREESHPALHTPEARESVMNRSKMDPRGEYACSVCGDGDFLRSCDECRGAGWTNEHYQQLSGRCNRPPQLRDSGHVLCDDHAALFRPCKNCKEPVAARRPQWQQPHGKFPLNHINGEIACAIDPPELPKVSDTCGNCGKPVHYDHTMSNMWRRKRPTDKMNGSWVHSESGEPECEMEAVPQSGTKPPKPPKNTDVLPPPGSRNYHTQVKVRYKASSREGHIDDKGDISHHQEMTPDEILKHNGIDLSWLREMEEEGKEERRTAKEQRWRDWNDPRGGGDSYFTCSKCDTGIPESWYDQASDEMCGHCDHPGDLHCPRCGTCNDSPVANSDEDDEAFDDWGDCTCPGNRFEKRGHGHHSENNMDPRFQGGYGHFFEMESPFETEKCSTCDGKGGCSAWIKNEDCDGCEKRREYKPHGIFNKDDYEGNCHDCFGYGTLPKGGYFTECPEGENTSENWDFEHGMLHAGCPTCHGWMAIPHWGPKPHWVPGGSKAGTMENVHVSSFVRVAMARCRFNTSLYHSTWDLPTKKERASVRKKFVWPDGKYDDFVIQDDPRQKRWRSKQCPSNAVGRVGKLPVCELHQPLVKECSNCGEPVRQNPIDDTWEHIEGWRSNTYAPTPRETCDRGKVKRDVPDVACENCGQPIYYHGGQFSWGTYWRHTGNDSEQCTVQYAKPPEGSPIPSKHVDPRTDQDGPKARPVMAALDPATDPRYPRNFMECFSCGLRGDYDTWGLPVQCPKCGSYEIHDPFGPHVSWHPDYDPKKGEWRTAHVMCDVCSAGDHYSCSRDINECGCYCHTAPVPAAEHARQHEQELERVGAINVLPYNREGENDPRAKPLNTGPGGTRNFWSDPHGYFGSGHRTKALDKALVDAANELDLSDQDVEEWGLSSNGRHFFDNYAPTYKCTNRDCGWHYDETDETVLDSPDGKGKICGCKGKKDWGKQTEANGRKHDGLCGAKLRGPLIPANYRHGYDEDFLKAVGVSDETLKQYDRDGEYKLVPYTHKRMVNLFKGELATSLPPLRLEYAHGRGEHEGNPAIWPTPGSKAPKYHKRQDEVDYLCHGCWYDAHIRQQKEDHENGLHGTNSARDKNKWINGGTCDGCSDRWEKYHQKRRSADAS